MSRPTMNHERELRAAGCRVVAGIDEAGRGPLAGPVCAAAVVLPEDFDHPVLTDSKQLTEKQRNGIYDELTGDGAISWHCVMVEVEEIDRLNILKATWLAMRRALSGLRVKADGALIDGSPVRDFPIRYLSLVKGDSRSFSIAAASVIAKVTRDRHMRELAAAHPQYGFEQHNGYGTPAHLEALRAHGPCPAHRRSFEPVAQLALPLELDGQEA